MRRVMIGTMTALLGLGIAGLAGCSESDEGELEKAGKQADEAIEQAGEDLEEAGKEVGKAIEGLGN